jgi:hypothetical protein
MTLSYHPPSRRGASRVAPATHDQLSDIGHSAEPAEPAEPSASWALEVRLALADDPEVQDP